MAIIDANNYFTTIGTPFAPTVASQENLAPLTIDTAPLTIPASAGGGAAAAGYNSTSGNTNAGRDLGVGGEMWWEVLITTAVAQTSGGAIFYLVTDSVAALTNVASQTGVGVLMGSPNLTAAKLVVQAYYRAQLPAGLTYQEFIGVDVYIFTNNWTAGALEAKLITNIEQADLYLSGFTLQ